MRLLHSVRNDIFIFVIAGTAQQSQQCVIAVTAPQPYICVIASGAWQSHKKINLNKSNTGLGLTSFIERRRNDPDFDFIVPYSNLEFCSHLSILYRQIG